MITVDCDVLDADGGTRTASIDNDLRFLNHSSRPNAEFRGQHLYAVRNIQSGDEVTFHYGDDWEDVE